MARILTGGGARREFLQLSGGLSFGGFAASILRRLSLEQLQPWVEVSRLYPSEDLINKFSSAETPGLPWKNIDNRELQSINPTSERKKIATYGRPMLLGVKTGTDLISPEFSISSLKNPLFNENSPVKSEGDFGFSITDSRNREIFVNLDVPILRFVQNLTDHYPNFDTRILVNGKSQTQPVDINTQFPETAEEEKITQIGFNVLTYTVPILNSDNGSDPGSDFQVSMSRDTPNGVGMGGETKYYVRLSIPGDRRMDYYYDLHIVDPVGGDSGQRIT